MDDVLKKVITCPTCLTIFTDPKSLSCRHTLCRKCIQKQQENGQILCPCCNKTTAVEDCETDVRTQSFVEDFTRSMSGASNVSEEPNFNRCEVCRNEDGTCVCKQCNQLLCINCKEEHLNCDKSKIRDVATLADGEKEKLQTFKADFQAKSQLVKAREDECRKGINKYELHVDLTIKSLEQEKIKILKHYDRQIECVREQFKRIKDISDEDILRTTLWQEKVQDLNDTIGKRMVFENAKLAKESRPVEMDLDMAMCYVNKIIEKDKVVFPAIELERRTFLENLAQVELHTNVVEKCAIKPSFEDLESKEWVCSLKEKKRFESQSAPLIYGGNNKYVIRTEDGNLYLDDFKEKLQLKCDFGKVNMVVPCAGGYVIASSNGLDECDMNGEFKGRIQAGKFLAVNVDADTNIISSVEYSEKKVYNYLPCRAEFAQKDEEWLQSIYRTCLTKFAQKDKQWHKLTSHELYTCTIDWPNKLGFDYDYMFRFNKLFGFSKSAGLIIEYDSKGKEIKRQYAPKIQQLLDVDEKNNMLVVLNCDRIHVLKANGELLKTKIPFPYPDYYYSTNKVALDSELCDVTVINKQYENYYFQRYTQGHHRVRTRVPVITQVKHEVGLLI